MSVFTVCSAAAVVLIPSGRSYFRWQCLTLILTLPSAWNEMPSARGSVLIVAERTFSPSLTNRSELFPLLDFSLNEAFKLKQNGYAVFVPGAGASYRRWPISRFAEIVKLVSAMGMKIAVVGGRKESSLVSDLAQASGVGVLDLSGKTTIQQLGGLLCHAKLVVSNETGAATFAALLGAKTICILGGGDFGSFFPNEYCPNAISVYHKEHCF